MYYFFIFFFYFFFLFFFLLPAMVDILFIRLHIKCFFIFDVLLNSWLIAIAMFLSTFIITVDGVDHLIGLIFPNHVPSSSSASFLFRNLVTSFPSSLLLLPFLAAPAFSEVPTSSHGGQGQCSCRSCHYIFARKRREEDEENDLAEFRSLDPSQLALP